MATRTRRVFALLAGVLLVAGVSAGLETPPDILALNAVEREVQAARRLYETVYFDQTKTPADRKAAREAYEAKHPALAARFLRVAEQHPGTVGGLSALLQAANPFPTTADGKTAMDHFLAQVATADVAALADALDQSSVFHSAELARALLDRAIRSPDHPRAGRLLAAACVAAGSESGEKPSPLFAEAATRIAERYADSPDIGHLGERIAHSVAEPWAAEYIPQLRTVAEKSPHRKVRCTVVYALAAATRAGGDEAAAEKLFEQYVAEFDGQTKYDFQGIEKTYRQTAERELAELRTCGVGKVASEIDGVDLDGKPLKLSDHRGKVVLVSFWATWCGPCMKLVPHERELVAKLAGKPFVLVGVNGDTEAEKAREAVTKHEITWRSVRDRRPDRPTVSQGWHVGGWPTLYLIDHTGVIRRRWAGAPATAELDRTVEELVAKVGGP